MGDERSNRYAGNDGEVLMTAKEARIVQKLGGPAIVRSARPT
jgi:hypothetical protein